jgi:hypothetical protein
MTKADTLPKQRAAMRSGIATESRASNSDIHGRRYVQRGVAGSDQWGLRVNRKATSLSRMRAV